MPWYYYSGKTVRPIPVKKGLSKSVRPHKKVEILEMTLEVQALVNKRELRRTSPPMGAESIADKPVPELKVEDVVRKSELASRFAEKGKTISKGIPPKTKSGEQEMTEVEMNVAKNGSSGPADGVVEAESLPKVEEKKGKKKGRRL